MIGINALASLEFCPPGQAIALFDRQRRRHERRIACLLLSMALGIAAAFFSVVSPANAQQPAGAIAVTPIDAARLLIADGQLDAADQVLSRQDQNDAEVLFLEGQVAGLRGDWPAAEKRYRKILDDHPELARARLELAHVLYEQEKDVAAEWHFRRALADDLPEPVIGNVNGYLQSIKQRKRWSLDASAGLLPDTNINRGPSAAQVQLFGLPFVLDQQAKQKSGVGASISLDGEYDAPLSQRTRLRSGASFFRNEYPTGKFDDMQVKPYVGPQVIGAWGEASLLGFAIKRWYGNAPYYQGAGARAELGWNAARRYRLDVGLEFAKLHFPDREFLDGYQLDLSTGHTYWLTPSSYVRGILGGGYQETRLDAFQNDYIRGGVGYGRDLPWALSVYLEPSVIQFWFDGTSFGQVRNDTFVVASLIATKRDWDVFGFAPTLTLAYQRNMSTVDVFSYDRELFQLGLTRRF